MIQKLGAPNQGKLSSVVGELFLDRILIKKDIIHNVRKGTQIVSPVSGSYLEFDIWIPSLNIAFEYQDPHHYISTWYENAPLKHVQFNDSWKKKEIEKLGATLIVVPCWWDGSKDSLISTIKKVKPTLLSSYHPHSLPIPDDPPPGYFKDIEIPGIGHPMLASFAEGSQINPKDWWLSEKYDGIRSFWSPSSHNLYLTTSDSVRKLFPPIFIDGELWAGRGSFDFTQKSFRSVHRHEWWVLGRMITLDNPHLDYHSSSFEQRYTILVNHLSLQHPFLILACNQKSKSKEHAERAMRETISQEGEGIVARQNGSHYIQGRSDLLLKFKTTRDAEGMILEHCGNFYMLQSKGGEIIRAQGPKEGLDVGDVVTYNFVGLNRISILRKRVDADWFSLSSSSSFSSSSFSSSYQTESENKNINLVFADPPPRHPRGYWTTDGNINIRNFFDNFASSRNLDPLNPQTWYNTPLGIFKNLPEWPLHHYSSNVVRALMDIYPDIGLDESKFDSARKNHWAVRRNRRIFFDKFAERQQFNPLDPSAWYHVNMKTIMTQRGGDAVLWKFNRSLVDALRDSYPELSFDSSQFKPVHMKTMPSYWRIAFHRKRFFDAIAKKKNFDPLIANNWYSITNDTIYSGQGAKVLMEYYNNSFIKALSDVYPDVAFDETKLKASVRKKSTSGVPS